MATERAHLYRETAPERIRLMATDHEIPWFRHLYEELLGYTGCEPYEDVLLPWLPRAQAATTALADFRQLFRPADESDDFNESLWNLYALSRVNDFLLLSFQDVEGRRWDGPRVTREQYVGFFEQIGFTAFTALVFSPFRHEIVEVLEADASADPVTVVEHAWPGLMFGNMVFSRGGARVGASSKHINKEVAEQSTLYFAYRRLRRKTEDLSLGWGSNSQWATRFRRDYEHDDCFLYNVDGKTDLTSDSQFSDKADNFSVRERIELCKNRCFVISKRASDDLWPIYDYRYCESQECPTPLSPPWLTWNDSLVRRLAASIRQRRTYDRLPILADALEEAGCCDEALLKHCREPVGHGSRCWALEYLLEEGVPP